MQGAEGKSQIKSFALIFSPPLLPAQCGRWTLLLGVFGWQRKAEVASDDSPNRALLTHTLHTAPLLEKNKNKNKCKIKKHQQSLYNTTFTKLNFICATEVNSWAFGDWLFEKRSLTLLLLKRSLKYAGWRSSRLPLLPATWLCESQISASLAVGRTSSCPHWHNTPLSPPLCCPFA